VHAVGMAQGSLERNSHRGRADVCDFHNAYRRNNISGGDFSPESFALQNDARSTSVANRGAVTFF
jgi:hypothetical protein